MCIDIMEIWFGIANGHISSFLAELSAHYTIVVEYCSFTFLFVNCFCLLFFFFRKTFFFLYFFRTDRFLDGFLKKSVL